MAIELPSNPDVLAERLALLDDPELAERLARENPALFPQSPPSTEREVLAWTTRRFGTAVIAATAALAVAAGYAASELRRGQPTALQTAPAPHAAAPAAPVVVAPLRRPPTHTAAPAHRSAPSAHRAASVAPHAAPIVQHAAPVVQHATPVVQHAVPVSQHAAPIVRHATPVAAHHAVAVPVPQPVRHHASATVAVHHAATALRTAPQSASDQLAAWEATHPASRTQPRSEPASSTSTSTATTNATAPSTGPGSYTGPATPGDQTPPGGARPPSGPNGGWSERPPGGILGRGGLGPVIGVPRDSCTPQGGRVGMVMEAIQLLSAAGRH